MIGHNKLLQLLDNLFQSLEAPYTTEAKAQNVEDIT